VAEVRTTPGSHVALTIAGSDSCGGAGIQADLKTFTVLGVFGATAVTAVTAQNTTGVKKVQVLEPDLVAQQIDVVASDIKINAAKTGMLGSAKNVEAVVDAIKRNGLYPLVVDPVMVAKSGDELIDDDAVKRLIKELLPQATVVTPNRHEAQKTLGMSKPINDLTTAAAAAREICLRTGASAALVKGFKRPNDEEGEAVDFFFDGEEVQEIAADWRPTDNTHGSGCVLASAITAGLALGHSLLDSIQTAKGLVSEAIRQSTDIGNGRAPVNPLAYLAIKK